MHFRAFIVLLLAWARGVVFPTHPIERIQREMDTETHLSHAKTVPSDRLIEWNVAARTHTHTSLAQH